MKTLNRGRHLLLVWDSQMRGVRATIACLVAALGLPGGMGRIAPVVYGQVLPI
jgi:hypothetical protein